jgi:hypothetical protein
MVHLSSQIYIEDTRGKRFPVRCTPASTVEDLKHGIHEWEGIPPDEQRLIFANKQMEDNRTLGDYGVQPDCEVYLMRRLRGC